MSEGLMERVDSSGTYRTQSYTGDYSIGRDDCNGETVTAPDTDRRDSMVSFPIIDGCNTTVGTQPTPTVTKRAMTAWDVVDEWELDHYLGGAVECICRVMEFGRTDESKVNDLDMAIDFLDHKRALLREKVVRSPITRV